MRHPLRPTTLLVRVPVAAIGAFVGGAAGLAVALVVGALFYTSDLDTVRLLAISAATVGVGVGFGAANGAATSLLRPRGGEELPPARIID